MNTYILNIMVLVFMLILSVKSQEIGITSGSKAGTYFRIANEIKDVCDEEISIQAYTSKGSLENIDRILTKPEYQFGIVQHDALLYKESIDPKLRNKIKMIFPLYNEEIHIIINTKSGINDLKDLSGRVVNTGREGSGVWLTSQMIKRLVNLNWTETSFSPQVALEKVMIGEIDAMIYVVGQPAPILIERLPEESSGYIKLLKYSHPKLDEYYVKSEIKAGVYPWHNETISVYATKAILVTFNYYVTRKSPKRFEYYVNNIFTLVKQINDNLDSLRKFKHPKWKEIDPADLDKVNWPVHFKAVEAIQEGKNDQLNDHVLQNILKKLKKELIVPILGGGNTEIDHASICLRLLRRLAPRNDIRFPVIERLYAAAISGITDLWRLLKGPSTGKWNRRGFTIFCKMFRFTLTKN